MLYLIVSLVGCKSPTSSTSAPSTDSTISSVYQHKCASPTEDGPWIAPVSLGMDWETASVPSETEYSGWGISVADYNEDGFWDVFLPNFGADTLLLSDSNGDLQHAGLPEHQGLSYGSSSADLDSDGDIDIVVAAEQGGHFYENRLPQGYRLHLEADSTIDPQLDGRTQGWAIADYDRDGFFDLFGPTFYARYGFSSSNPPDLPFDNLIYKGIGDFQWLRKQGWSAYVERSAANAGGWVDIDDDGDLDLFVISDKPDLFLTGVLRNTNGELNDWRDTGLEVPIQGMGLAWGDLNLDGLIDFGITGWDELAILLNDGQQWYDAAFSIGARVDSLRLVGWGIEFADMNNDGLEDILVANGPDYSIDGELGVGPIENAAEQFFSLYLNNGSTVELQRNEQWDFGLPRVYRGFALVDWNRDGFLDVLARDLSGPPVAYLSQCGSGRALEVSLQQAGRNAAAIGARLWVTTADGVRRFRDIQAGSSNISSSSPALAHFGLGAAETVSLEVRWPDGEVESLGSVATGQRIVITRN